MKIPNCPTCSTHLVQKEGLYKICAQIGNPDIAVVVTEDPNFCETCNEYFLETNKIASAIKQIKNMSTKKSIEKGLYS